MFGQSHVKKYSFKVAGMHGSSGKILFSHCSNEVRAACREMGFAPPRNQLLGTWEGYCRAAA